MILNQKKNIEKTVKENLGIELGKIENNPWKEGLLRKYA
jgi:hypothetical protein